MNKQGGKQKRYVPFFFNPPFADTIAGVLTYPPAAAFLKGK